MKTILCPVDFSEDSVTAAKFAFDICARSKGRLVLLHSYHMPSREAGINYDAETSAKVQKEGESKLKKLINGLIELNPLADVSFTPAVIYGFAADDIPVQAKAYNADLVVMNTGGAEGIVKEVVGTVSVSVMEHSTCPVLIIPNGWNFSPFNKIVYATDLEGDQERLIGKVADFANLYQSKLLMLHVLQKKDMKSDKESAEVPLKKLLHAKGISDYSFRFYMEEDVVDGISRFCAEEKADLLVMAMKTQSFWEKLFNRSKTKRIAFHTQLPVLGLHK